MYGIINALRDDAFLTLKTILLVIKRRKTWIPKEIITIPVYVVICSKVMWLKFKAQILPAPPSTI